MMRKVCIIFILLCAPLFSQAQVEKLPDPEGFFSALIVDNIEESITWYRTYLGFKLINKREFPIAGFKQANLKRGTFFMELIELDSAVAAKDVISNYNSKTRIQGIFKIGFTISKFDRWVKHLKESNIKFHGTVVKDKKSGKKMVIIKDPDGNKIQLFEK